MKVTMQIGTVVNGKYRAAGETFETDDPKLVDAMVSAGVANLPEGGLVGVVERAKPWVTGWRRDR